MKSPTRAGKFTATATTTGTNEAATFSLDNLAGKPPTITAAGQAKRSALVGAHYAKPLQVKVLNGNGNPIHWKQLGQQLQRLRQCVAQHSFQCRRFAGPGYVWRLVG